MGLFKKITGQNHLPGTNDNGLRVYSKQFNELVDDLEKIEGLDDIHPKNFDFTDTLSYLTEEDYEINVGKEFLGSWQNLVFTGDVLGSVITSDNHSIFNIIGDGETEIDPIGLSFPDQLSGQLLKITSGDLSGSSLSNLIKYSDDTLLGGDERFLNFRESIFVDPSSGDVTEIIDGYLIDSSASSYEITKTNNSGETVKLEVLDSESGFKLSNDLADNTASVLRIEDNNGDARLEVKNDGVTLSDLTIDFTDTLSYVTDNDLESPFGFQYIPAFGGFIDTDFSGDFIGSKYEGSDVTISKGIFDGETELVGLGVSVPSSIAGTIYEVNSGDYSGSSLFHGSVIVDNTGVGGSLTRNFSLRGNFIDTVSGDKTYMGHELGIGDSTPFYNVATKTNSSGEVISMELYDSANGFVIANDLSDNTASVIRIEDNNGDAILEFFNDYLVSETIPALDYADDAAAATGGVPVGGIYHNSGTIRIRLT